MQFAGVDSSSPPVIDIPRQCMELLDLEKPAPDACAEPRLGQVAEQELGLEDATQVPVGAVEVILGRARDDLRRGRIHVRKIGAVYDLSTILSTN